MISFHIPCKFFIKLVANQLLNVYENKRPDPKFIETMSFPKSAIQVSNRKKKAIKSYAGNYAFFSSNGN